MVSKLLTPTATKNVFSPKNEAYALFKIGGTTYISNGTTSTSDPNTFTKVLISQQNMTFDEHGHDKMIAANQELLGGRHIAGASKDAMNPKDALKTIIKAEKTAINIDDTHREVEMLNAVLQEKDMSQKDFLTYLAQQTQRTK
jgi:hypothetical protein